MGNKINDLILVPTDFSETCKNAIDHGIEIAEYLNYKLTLLHVINKDTKAQLKKEQLPIDAVNIALNEIKEEIATRSDVEVDVMVTEGSIFDEIQKVAEDIGAKLMVLGTHGKKGLQYLFGSFALKVVMKSPVPVIVVQKRPFKTGYHKIVFPINDFTEARQKVQWAKYIAKTFDAKIHIFRQPHSDPGIASRIKIITHQVEEVLQEAGVEYSVEMAEKTQNFANQMLDFAVTINADLMMIMTDSDIYSPDFRLGPWDEKLMFNEAQIPVMCINPIQTGTVHYQYITLI